MAVKHLSYLDLTPQQRQEGAKKGRERIQALLMSPFITGDQAAVLQQRMEHIDKWERGEISVPPRPELAVPMTIPSPPPAAPESRKPVNHVVQVGETVKVSDKVS